MVTRPWRVPEVSVRTAIAPSDEVGAAIAAATHVVTGTKTKVTVEALVETTTVVGDVIDPDPGRPVLIVIIDLVVIDPAAKMAVTVIGVPYEIVVNVRQAPRADHQRLSPPKTNETGGLSLFSSLPLDSGPKS